MNDRYHLPTEESVLDGAYRSFCENLEGMVQNHNGEWVAIRSDDGQILGYGSSLTEIADKYYTKENMPVLLTKIPNSVEESKVKLIDGKVHYKITATMDPFGRLHFKR